MYRLRMRESDQLKTVLELYDMEIHQKISMPDHQKLKKMVKRSIDQKLRLRNFDARNGEGRNRLHWLRVVNVVLKEKRILKGHCSRGDNCSFQHDENKRAKPTPKSAAPSEPPTLRGRSTPQKISKTEIYLGS